MKILWKDTWYSCIQYQKHQLYIFLVLESYVLECYDEISKVWLLLVPMDELLCIAVSQMLSITPAHGTLHKNFQNVQNIYPVFKIQGFKDVIIMYTRWWHMSKNMIISYTRIKRLDDHILFISMAIIITSHALSYLITIQHVNVRLDICTRHV